ncbi:MAG TPA: hypothetical protein VKB18_00045 [Gemmatimonadota bacterium]|nr:hypothetical protein [Gemmatimonadota bacterium]
MHSEHLRNVRFSWIAFGWFVGFAVASSLVLMLAALGILDRSTAVDAAGMAASVAIGWVVGGFITGFKVAAAPILHGAAMALFTFMAWFVLNLVFGGITTGTSAWEALSVRIAALALLVQGVAAIVGCWLGYRYAPVRVE